MSFLPRRAKGSTRAPSCPYTRARVGAGGCAQIAGLSNTQNVRMETNAGFTVERLPAALRIL